jgi:putative ABC transport system permease protein
MCFAVRLSLGASRSRLVSQLLGETAVLAAVGGAAGAFLAFAGLAAWQAWAPSDFPQMVDLTLDHRVMTFAFCVSAMTALGCSVVPAWFVSRDVADSLRGSVRTMTIGLGQTRMQRAFVAAQIAVATILLIGMGLMTHGLARLERVSPGFTVDRTLSIQLSLPPRAYGNRDALVHFVEALRERLGTVAGVESAGAVSLLPLSGLLSAVDIALPDRPVPPPDQVPQAHFRIATPEYFAAAGIPVLEGRVFSIHDRQDSKPVAIVSRTFAARHWPGESAIGKPVQIVQSTGSRRLEIIGAVSDVKHFSVDAASTADLYVPVHQMPASQAPLFAARMFWIVRTRAESPRLADDVRQAVSEVDPGVASSSVRTLESVWFASLGPRRANVRLLQFFSNVAVVLCAIGGYGVAAFSARTRRRELAIRAALGASRRELTMTMLRSELQPVLAGLLIGLPIAFLVAPILFGGAFETNPRGMVTYVAVAAGLMAVASAATYMPIRQAVATNPAEALQ